MSGSLSTIERGWGTHHSVATGVGTKIEARTRVDLLEVARQADAAKGLGATLIASGLLPNGITKPEAAVAIMLAGRELELAPMFALKNIAVIQGTPALSEQAMGLLIRRAGHKLRVIESTNERCVVEGERTDDPGHKLRVQFTVEDAKRAGLLGKSSWKNYTRAMLRARAKAELGRSMFEDALAGLVYTVEELGAEVDEEGQIVEAGSAEPMRDEAEDEVVYKVEGETLRRVDPEHARLITEIERIYWRIPERNRPEEGDVFPYAEAKIGNARKALKSLEEKARMAGMLPMGSPDPPRGKPPEEPQEARLIEEDTAPPAERFGDLPGEAGEAGESITANQRERITALADELYGDQEGVLEGEGHQVYEQDVLHHSIFDLSRSGAEVRIRELEEMVEGDG